jgi:hypothetical protein
MSKLPSDIRLQTAQKVTKEAWKIDESLTTIKLEIEAREMSESTKSSGNNQQASKYQDFNSKNNGNKPTAAAMFVNNGQRPRQFQNPTRLL